MPVTIFFVCLVCSAISSVLGIAKRNHMLNTQSNKNISSKKRFRAFNLLISMFQGKMRMGPWYRLYHSPDNMNRVNPIYGSNGPYIHTAAVIGPNNINPNQKNNNLNINTNANTISNNNPNTNIFQKNDPPSYSLIVNQNKNGNQNSSDDFPLPVLPNSAIIKN